MGSRLEKNSNLVKKRIEEHTFEDEHGEEYEGSAFGGFGDYFRRKKIKLQNLDAEIRSSSSSPQIFRGIVAHVNGYTQPSLNDLHHLIVSHGGGFQQYLDGKTTVTHIIAASLTPKKAVEFRRYRIVKPAWIVDSVKAGKLLPWDSYKVLSEGPGQRVLGFNGKEIVSQVNPQTQGYHDQTNLSWYGGQVRDIAEMIEDGLQPVSASTKAHRKGALEHHMSESSLEPRKDGDRIEDTMSPRILGNDATDHPEDFEITPSLEAALNDAEVMHEEHLDIPNDDPLGNETSTDTLMQPLDAQDTDPSRKAKVITAEEHNAMLISDPNVWKSTTANPGFLKQFYSESRLHHLSAWKADLKAKMQQMAAEKSSSQKQSVKRKPGARRYVFHVDFDSFFCAVSLKNSPEYSDKPAVVAHGTGSGSEIASSNYPARSFGIKNGMWMKQALQLCPTLKVLPYDFPAYEEASRQFYEAILGLGGIVQSVSVDEALVDVTALVLPAGGSDGVGLSEGSMWREQEKADQIADELRTQIKQKTGCSVSVGIGGNILLAKLALRKAKPAGQYHIKPEEVLDFIGELGVQDLPGVAYSIGGRLEEIGVKFVKDICSLSKERLTTILGPKTGEKLWDYARGIDKTEVGEHVVRKSVSADVNWGIRFISQAEAEEFVHNLCIELQKRMLDAAVRGKQLTMKIMKRAADAPLDPPKHLGHGKCDTFNKSVVLGVATNNPEIIGRQAVSILRSYGFSPGELRGIGVQMTQLEPLKNKLDGSQKRIDFLTSFASKSLKKSNDEIKDVTETPKKTARVKETAADSIDEIVTPTKPKAVALSSSNHQDPINDDFSPIKPKQISVHPAIAIGRANATDKNSKRPLNVAGTQFIIPTQIDPEVLSELPQDIRSRLLSQSRDRIASREQSPAFISRDGTPSLESRDHSPTRQGSLPPDIDPEVFEALPADVKAEVLASHRRSTPIQSPRKPRSSNAIKKNVTPTKSRKNTLFRGRHSRQASSSTLTQSNFVTKSEGWGKPTDGGALSEDYESEELDPNFLAALPEDVRQEVVTEHRRRRLAKRSGLAAPAPGKKKRPLDQDAFADIQQTKIYLPSREQKPSFTTQKLTSLPQLRETISAWHKEFAGEGPHPDDVAAMGRYLRRVVLEEKNMDKVVGVVKWIEWLIEEMDDEKGRDAKDGKTAWSQAFQEIKSKVQAAVEERGLGKLIL
ncbi:hypothetical protein F5884DRAFT_666643 [Xylogone sp. PMI_703]|nr:hypothetical protein F5884DRAFT_666643 [Xylogone sp. PMI_703]